MRICQTLDAWLGEDEGNVAVLLSESRGRAAFVASCYLVYQGEVDTPAEALTLFDARVPGSALRVLPVEDPSTRDVRELTLVPGARIRLLPRLDRPGVLPVRSR